MPWKKLRSCFPDLCVTCFFALQYSPRDCTLYIVLHSHLPTNTCIHIYFPGNHIISSYSKGSCSKECWPYATRPLCKLLVQTLNSWQICFFPACLSGLYLFYVFEVFSDSAFKFSLREVYGNEWVSFSLWVCGSSNPNNCLTNFHFSLPDLPRWCSARR